MTESHVSSLRIAEEIGRLLGCRWSIALLTNIREGIDRPGAMQRANLGLTEKVLRFCLSRMVKSGVLQRIALPGRVKGTAYRTTEYGKKVMDILDQINDAVRHAPKPKSGGVARPREDQGCPAPR